MKNKILGRSTIGGIIGGIIGATVMTLILIGSKAMMGMPVSRQQLFFTLIYSKPLLHKLLESGSINI